MASNATAQNAPGLDPVLSEPVGHGNSVAAWTAVGVMLVGTLIGCISFALHAPIGVYIGIAVVVVGLIVGGIMRKAGFGVGGHRSTDDSH